jgi:hypothetical protein
MNFHAEEGMLYRAVADRGHIGLSLSLSFSLITHACREIERERYMDTYKYTNIQCRQTSAV